MILSAMATIGFDRTIETEKKNGKSGMTAVIPLPMNDHFV